MLVKNSVIEEWEWAKNVHEMLKEWKRRDFDRKVERKMKKSQLV